jgi:hypothetical protein
MAYPDSAGRRGRRFSSNVQHQAQQGSFATGHLALAENLAAGHGYALSPSEPLFSRCGVMRC